jgi:hypothetical protein
LVGIPRPSKCEVGHTTLVSVIGRYNSLISLCSLISLGDISLMF